MPGQRTALLSSLAVLCLLVSSTGSLRSADGDDPGKQVWDFGVVPQKSEVGHRFYVRNTDAKPLVISKIKAGCSCISAPELPDPIAPGDSVAIPVVFKTGRYSGRVRKTTKIYAGDDENVVQSLVITADVQSDGLTGPIRIDPVKLTWMLKEGKLGVTEDTLTVVSDRDSQYEVTVLDIPGGIVDETAFPEGRTLGKAVPVSLSLSGIPVPPDLRGPSITLSVAGADTTIVTVPIELKD